MLYIECVIYLFVNGHQRRPHFSLFIYWTEYCQRNGVARLPDIKNCRMQKCTRKTEETSHTATFQWNSSYAITRRWESEREVSRFFLFMSSLCMWVCACACVFELTAPWCVSFIISFSFNAFSVIVDSFFFAFNEFLNVFVVCYYIVKSFFSSVFSE